MHAVIAATVLNSYSYSVYNIIIVSHQTEFPICSYLKVCEFVIFIYPRIQLYYTRLYTSYIFILQKTSTQKPGAVDANAVRYHQNPTRTIQDTDYGNNYVSPNKIENSVDGEGYLVLTTMQKQVNPHQSLNANREDDGDIVYDGIAEPDQPQYEILPGEADEQDQYLDVIAGRNEDEEPQDQYLDVLPANEDIYSDISDSAIEQIRQEALENHQELEIYD